MAEKNTISILESIKKKIQKFDQPRKPENSAFKDVGEEFDYISTNKTEAVVEDSVNPVEAVKEHPALPTTQSAAHTDLDQELEDSFSDFLNKSTTPEVTYDASKQPIESNASAPKEPEHLEEVGDDFQDFLQEESNANNESSAGEESKKIDASPLFAKPEANLNLDPQDDFNFLEEDEENNPQQSLPENHDELYLEHEEEYEENHENVAGDIEKDFLQPSPKKDDSKISYEESEDEKFLKELRRQEESRLKDEALGAAKDFAQKIQSPKALSQNNFMAEENTISAEPLASSNDDFMDDDSEDFLNDHATNYTADKTDDLQYLDPINNFDRQNLSSYHDKKPQIMDAANSILKQKTVVQASDSIKKLLDAKNVVSTVASFAKSDNFNEMALQLMEPKLEKWLNENLPSLVEKIVREEINKIIPKK